MREERREEAPPLAGLNSGFVHDAAIENAGGLVVYERMNQGDKDAEDDGAPVDFEVGAWELLAPGPAAVFDAVLADGILSALEFVGADEEEPALTFGRAFDDGFNALAGEDKAPIHGLPP